MAYFDIILLVLSAFFCCSYCDTFNYFAYGSNLIGKRLKINSPSAEFYGVAVLEDHRLDFSKYNKMWNGAVATIVEDPGESVTGAVWVIDMKDMPHLDNQEGVNKGLYFAKNVTVTTPNGQETEARTYELVENPPKLNPAEDLPYDRRPSNTYLEVLIFGAVESGLPSDYIGYLVSFPTNGKQATDKIREQLGYPFGPKQENKTKDEKRPLTNAGTFRY